MTVAGADGEDAIPGLADPVTIRVVSKDLLTTNPDDVKLVKNIEEALKAQGTDIAHPDRRSALFRLCRQAERHAALGRYPDLIYFQGGDAKMAEQGVLEDLNNWLPKTTYLKDALFPHNVERLKNYPYLLYVYPPRIPQPVIRTDWLAKKRCRCPADGR